MARILTDFGIVAVPSIDPTFGRVSVRRQPGTTLGQCVDDVIPETWGPSRRQMRVTLDGHVIPEALWERVRPKAGTAVLIEVVPADSKTLRSVLTIAVAIAAVAAGQFYGASLGASRFGSMQGASFLGSVLISTAVPANDEFASDVLGTYRSAAGALQ